jgi:hypothetical protein
MYFAGSISRAAATNRDNRYSRFRSVLLPCSAEFFVAASFAASMNGWVRACLERHGNSGAGWTWAGAFVIAVLPAAIRWTADFLSDPGGDPSEIPEWLEAPVLQSAVFVLFAARPDIVTTFWGWVPFARGSAHPAWASAAAMCLAVAALAGAQIWSRRRIHFVPAAQGPDRAFAAGVRG